MTQLLHICLSKGWGGLEMYPLRVGSGMMERGWRLYGLALRGSKVAEGMKERGFEVFEVDSRGQALCQLLSLRRWLKARAIRLVHCHKSGDLLLGALLKSLLPLRLLFTEHMGVTRPKRDLLHRWIYGKVDLVLSISDETRRRNLKALPLPASRIERLWLGTDLATCEELPAGIRAELGVAQDALLLGVLGRIGRGKGQRDLLEAFLLLATRYPQLHLLIVGGTSASEGSDEAVVTALRQRAAEAGMSDRVLFTGFRRDTPRMLRVMDLVAIPSHNEAFGLTVIEAMAAGKAIVGASTGAVPEVLGEAGLLAVPTDPAALAAQIERLLVDEALRQQLGQAARARAEREFSMSHHLDELARRYLA
jgi:glycosyltransferase involved in cell wall biosynthesis